jgi:murein DD-endopeptidase MepM/ murein hydrolase activator NlpD
MPATPCSSGRSRFVRIAAAFALAACSDTQPAAPADPALLTLTPSALTLRAEATIKLHVTLTNGDSPPGPITMTTSDERIAGVRADTIIGRAGGSATITVTSGARTATLHVTVPTDITLGTMGQPLDSIPQTSNVFDHFYPREFTDANGFLLSYWGEHMSGIDGHNGYDWVVPQGTPVRAVASGTVFFAGNETPFICPILGNITVSGLWIDIAHAAPQELLLSEYGHLSRIDVKRGDSVKAGQQIGLSGTTGCSTGPHLHFATFRMRGHESVTRAGDPITTRVMDPFGWRAAITDPWAADTSGMESLALWSGASAPSLYGEIRFPGGAAVLPTVLRLWGVDDIANPNNEYVDIKTFGSVPQDVSGWTLQNSAGNRFVFPAGTVVTQANGVRVYSGSGTNRSGTLYWGQPSGVWVNTGDCLMLFDARGTREFASSWSGGSCAGGAAEGSLLAAPPLDWSPFGRAPIVR